MKEINHKLRLKQQSNCYLVVFPSNLLFASLLWLTFLCFSYNQVLLGFILTYTETFLLFFKNPLYVFTLIWFHRPLYFPKTHDSLLCQSGEELMKAQPHLVLVRAGTDSRTHLQKDPHAHAHINIGLCFLFLIKKKAASNVQMKDLSLLLSSVILCHHPPPTSKCCLLTLSSHSSALQLSAPLWICGIFEPLKGHILSFPLSSFYSTSYWILRVVTHYIFKHQRVSFVFYLLCHSLTHTHTQGCCNLPLTITGGKEVAKRQHWAFPTQRDASNEDTVWWQKEKKPDWSSASTVRGLMFGVVSWIIKPHFTCGLPADCCHDNKRLTTAMLSGTSKKNKGHCCNAL